MLRYILKIRFDWDPGKGQANATKHGIRFEEAVTLFDDPRMLLAEDEKHSRLEKRGRAIGKTDAGTIVTAIFTDRENGAIRRLISARPANRRERRLYEEISGVPVSPGSETNGS